MALKGTLKDFSLADIFQLIAIQKKTGILLLKRDDDDEVEIKFLDGMIVGAESKKGKADLLLGKLLVRIGAITQDELEVALEVQKSTMKRLGQILIEKNFISKEDLKEALKKRVLEIVYGLFRWRRGSYDFKPLTNVDYDRENFEPLSTESVLMEGLRMIDEWPVIERRLNKPEVVYKKTGKIPEKKEREVDAFLVENEFLEDNSTSSLPYEMEYVLGLVDGMSSLKEIVQKSKLIEFYTYRALFDLLEKGYIEPTEISVPDLPYYEKKRNKEIAGEKVILFAIIVCVIFVITLLTSFSSPINRILPGPNTFVSENYKDVVFEFSKLKAIKVRELQRLFNFSFSMKPEVFIRVGENTYVLPGKYDLNLPVSFYLNEEIEKGEER